MANLRRGAPCRAHVGASLSDLPYAMPLIISSQPVDINGVMIRDYLSEPALKIGRPWNMRPRKASERVDKIVLHTTLGWPDHKHLTPQRVRDEAASASECRAVAVINDWKKGGRFAGSQLILDADGTLFCCADLAKDAAYHAPPLNGRSIGIEVVQQRDSSLFRAQLDMLPRIVDRLSEIFPIERRVAFPYRGKARLDSVTESAVWGHRDVTNDRGAGDPGDFIMQSLVDAGWEPF